MSEEILSPEVTESIPAPKKKSKKPLWLGIGIGAAGASVLAVVIACILVVVILVGILLCGALFRAYQLSNRIYTAHQGKRKYKRPCRQLSSIASLQCHAEAEQVSLSQSQ